jgi:hypothetical protein
MNRVGKTSSALAFLFIMCKIIYESTTAYQLNSFRNKKRAAIFLAALSFGFKWSVEWKGVKAIGTAQRNKANNLSETA